MIIIILFDNRNILYTMDYSSWIEVSFAKNYLQPPFDNNTAPPKP